MVDKRYGIPFVAALALNLVYWGVVGDWFGHIKPPETPKKDLVINLDMGQQEPPQEKKDPEKLKIQPDDKPVAGGGKAGSVLPDLSGKPTEGLKNLNPYLGGNETASVNLNSWSIRALNPSSRHLEPVRVATSPVSPSLYFVS